MLITTAESRLLLVAATPAGLQLLGRSSLSEQGDEILSHPALVGNHFYVRLGARVVRPTLNEPDRHRQ